MPLTAVDVDRAGGVVSLVLGDPQQGLRCASSKASIVSTAQGLRFQARWDTCGKVTGVHLRGLIDAATCGTLTGEFTITTPAVATPVTAITGQGDSVRFLTANIQMVPSSFLASTSKQRSRQIADRVLASGYDFVVFNEAFDEDIREILIRRLRDTFPHFVSALGTPQPILEDSGLMLFSRFPFAPLPDPAYQVCLGRALPER